MSATIACLAGEEVYRQWDAGHITGRRIGPRQTPFGESGEVFLVESDGRSFYLMPRYGRGMSKTAPNRVNNRANLYALKDLGVKGIIAWAPGGAITHTIAVGDLVILTDVIDRTYLRDRTYFEDSPLGYLRQFPVFCPALRKAVGEVLHDMKLVYHGAGTAAVCEGPRLETPAEIRMLTTLGAEIATHTFVPEVFLARELQMCYAGICYVVNYAESGSRHKPFVPGALFGGLADSSEADRVAGVLGAMSQTILTVAAALAENPLQCECNQSLRHYIEEFHLPADWHQWFDVPPAGSSGGSH